MYSFFSHVLPVLTPTPPLCLGLLFLKRQKAQDEDDAKESATRSILESATRKAGERSAEIAHRMESYILDHKVLTVEHPAFWATTQPLESTNVFYMTCHTTGFAVV